MAAASVAAWTERAEAALRRGDLDDAVFALAAATQLAPGSAGLFNNLALVLLEAGRPREAQSAAERAVALDARHALAHAHLGRALGEQGRTEAARDAFRAALAIDASIVAARFGLATALAHLGQWTEASAAFDEAIRVAPGAGEVWLGKANCLLHAGRRRDAVGTLHKGAYSVPVHAAALESYALFAMQYGDELDTREIFEAHVSWAHRFAPTVAPPPPRVGAIEGRIRIGYVSPVFHASAMAFALLATLRRHDRERFEIVAYSDIESPDAVTQQVRESCDHWRDTRGLGDPQFADAVRGDRIDVLVDLAGHTPGNRLRAFALRPAPVQVSWLDYFNTTGVAAIDAIVADDGTLATPLAQSFVERVISAGPCRYAYAPPEGAPEPTVRDATGPVVFGSFARLAKVCPTTLDAWCAALGAVQGSRLLLKNDSFADAGIRADVQGAFRRKGIDPARLELRPASPHAQMLAQYADVDVVLDTFPYNGGITTLEALWMGRPVLTMAGGTLVGRQCASILSACGHPEWIAADVGGFARAAVKLAADRETLARLHRELRPELARSPLGDAQAFTRRLEGIYASLLEGRAGAG